MLFLSGCQCGIGHVFIPLCIHEFLLLQVTLAAEQIFVHDGKYSFVPFCSVFPIHCGLKIVEPVEEQKPMPLSAES